MLKELEGEIVEIHERTADIPRASMSKLGDLGGKLSCEHDEDAVM